MTPIDFEFGFKTLWGLAAAAFWFWMNNLSSRLKDADRRAEELKGDVHRVMLDYATKEDVKADRANVSRALERIENKLDKLAEQKADK